jgi:hypothetical protein
MLVPKTWTITLALSDSVTVFTLLSAHVPACSEGYLRRQVPGVEEGQELGVQRRQPLRIQGAVDPLRGLAAERLARFSTRR